MKFTVESKKFAIINAHLSKNSLTQRYHLEIELTGHIIRGSEIVGRVYLEELREDDGFHISNRFGENWQSNREKGQYYLELRKKGGSCLDRLCDSFHKNVNQIIMTVVDYVDKNVAKLKKEEKLYCLRSRYYEAIREIEEHQEKIKALTQEKADLLKQLNIPNEKILRDTEEFFLGTTATK